MKKYKGLIISFVLAWCLLCAADTNLSDKQIARKVYNAAYEAYDVCIQDQTSELVDYYFTQPVDTTTLKYNAVTDDTILYVNDTSGASVGIAINIYSECRLYQGVINAVPNDSTVIVSAPLDMDLDTSTAVIVYANWDMAVNGSTTPQVFEICPPCSVQWDITRIIFNLVDTGTFTALTYGAMADGLDKGIVFRVSDGSQKNLFTIYNNSGFYERAYDVDINTSGFFGTGVNGLTCRRTFGGQNKNGVVIRLDGATNDCIQLIIQDDLTDLDKQACVGQGHVVEND